MIKKLDNIIMYHFTNRAGWKGLNEVQALLGHKSPETSMIYVHMASPKMINVKSPLDN